MTSDFPGDTRDGADGSDPFVRRLVEQLDAAAAAAGSSQRPATDALGAAVLAQLARDSTWTAPPPQLRDAVLARVLVTTTQSPSSSAVLAPSPSVVPAPPLDAVPALPPSAVPTSSASREPDGGRRAAVVRPLVPRWRRLSWAVPAVAAAAVILVGGTLTVEHAWPDHSATGQTYVALGTPQAPGATAEVTVAAAGGGFSVVLDLHRLPAAPAGTYYAAWLNDGHVSVPLGSFHARRGGAPIKLWSGVDPRRFTRFTVTLQRDDEPPFPPGQRFLTGTVSR